jgi:hypothetical protein
MTHLDGYVVMVHGCRWCSGGCSGGAVRCTVGRGWGGVPSTRRPVRTGWSSVPQTQPQWQTVVDHGGGLKMWPAVSKK